MTETLNDLYLSLRHRFKTQGFLQPELEAREVAATAAGADKRRTANWGHMYISEETIARADELAGRRADGEPLAYLLGEWDFCGLTFQVNRSVLVPRVETELLCEQAVSYVRQVVNPRVLDLCCGSGCIGITLLHMVDDARLTGMDISEDALALSRDNALKLGVSGHFMTMQGDALQPPSDRLGRFHLIVCNPPYITAKEMKLLDRSVKEYEPVLALYGGDDGLDFYRSLSCSWKDALLPGGLIMMECGYLQGAQVAALFEEQGWCDLQVVKDLSGIPRIVTARAPWEAQQI